ncbi:ABC transporter substrate-binding protein [Nodularia harveyana UHCC-0300]|uniref:ABC transporter substrate-binding protein n=1 Tax=Nodularia harveyana UHCC-0300 TaxID=2974287 RepID=A0ABU5UEE3_9CYAN|nr:ABC transporter substrate-binding protein [Nodularia harveyana]MEA5581544.1 ABC transporter substrate-binding protein [Nodularia harveyana UHCC-0300]
MSHKKETTILLLSLMVTLGLVGGGLLLFKDEIFPENPAGEKTPSNKSVSDRISFGEKILTPGDVNPDKTAGVQALANKDYPAAISSLETTLKQQRNNPEALIYLNNARIGSDKSYSIVASIPLGNAPNSALEILRGIAQAQDAVNSSGGIKGVPLKVGIANDNDNPEISQQIATSLVKNPDVLGVVGPNASDTTLAAGTVYNTGKLVAISPTSTSVKITNFSPYVFRTVPSDFMAARSLANYMVKDLQKTQAAVFFNSQSNYSQSLKTEFVSSLSLEGGGVLREFDLSQPNFSAAKSLEQAIQEGAEVVMLATNTATLDKGLQVVQVNQKRLNLLGGDDVYNIKTLEVGREQASGMVVAVPWHILGETNSDFPQTSRQLWGADVSWRTAMAYDATVALIAALEKNPTRSGVQQALSASDFSATGVAGAVKFLPSGDRRAAVQLVKIVKGERSRTGYDFEPVP